jgi:antitoxin (DNA-binding transcriptional repressor) of toxin-antitoxin stability system
MSAILNLTEAKAKFSEVVERASRGKEIIVTHMGCPVAYRSHGTSQGGREPSPGALRGPNPHCRKLQFLARGYRRRCRDDRLSMRFLVDTLALLWALGEPSTLSRELTLISRDPDITKYDVAVLPS